MSTQPDLVTRQRSLPSISLSSFGILPYEKRLLTYTNFLSYLLDQVVFSGANCADSTSTTGTLNKKHLMSTAFDDGVRSKLKTGSIAFWAFCRQRHSLFLLFES